MDERTPQEVEDDYAESQPKTKISCELNCFAAQALASMLNDQITKHRLEKKMDHLMGRVSDAEYEWHKGHAGFLEEEIAKKIFPDWGK